MADNNHNTNPNANTNANISNDTITFTIGEETRPVIESKKEGSLFHDQYQKALLEIDSFLDEQNCPKKQNDNAQQKEDPWQNEFHNNIFAFIGERGSGKTSCMLSAIKMIEKYQKTETNIKDNEYSAINKNTFHKLDLIDPSFFEEKCNILELVVAQMFNKIKDAFKNKSAFDDSCETPCENSYNDKKKLIEKFQCVQHDLFVMHNEKSCYEQDEVDSLVDLAASISIKKKLNNLIACYLKFFNKGNLILIIDDIDLNTRYAQTMVEQIRKYLILPNVLIFMAIKLEQLEQVIQLNFYGEFEKLLNKEELMRKEQIVEMADRYIDKLFPRTHRIYLPDVDTFLADKKLILKTLKDDKEEKEPKPIRHAVLSLIYAKTRYLFYNSKDATSHIIPRNLRTLRHLIALLFNMKEYDGKSDSLYNKILFKKYLFDTWTNENLDRNGQESVKNLLKIQEAVMFNKSVLLELQEYFEQWIGTNKLKELDTEIQFILNINNSNFNISIGDVFGVISYLEKMTNRMEDIKLLFIIKTIYSIKLYEYYDELTATCDKETTEKEKDYPILKEKLDLPSSNYQRLIGGNFINSALEKLLPDNSTTGNRCRRKIYGELLLKIRDQVFEKSESKGNIQIFDGSFENSSIDIPWIDAVNLVEFFILHSSCVFDDKQPNYRLRPDSFYKQTLDNPNTKNIYFDISSFTYNLISIKETYQRLEKQINKPKTKEKQTFYDVCKQCNSSILNGVATFMEQKENKRKINSDHNWLSWVSIRNAEVLQDFIMHLQNKQKGEDDKVIKEFYNNVSNYKIKTYDPDDTDNSKYYEITFPFLKKIAENEMSKDVFNLIYNYYSKFFELNISFYNNDKPYSKTSIWNNMYNLTNNKKVDIKNNKDVKKIFDKYFKEKKDYTKEERDNLLPQVKEEVDALKIPIPDKQ